jgi:hypothetical protein
VKEFKEIKITKSSIPRKGFQTFGKTGTKKNP